MGMNTLISKLLFLFVTSNKGKIHQVDISSSLGELALSSSSASSLPEPSSLSSSEVGGIRPTRVFTYHNLSLRVSRWASMRTSCAMMASSITPPAEDEGEKVDGAVEAGGVAVSVQGCFGLSCASLRRKVAASMAHITEKWEDLGWRINVITMFRNLRPFTKSE